jgi:hypothetical protein
MIESIYKYGGPSVKGFVLLESAVAVLNHTKTRLSGKDYTENDWNPVYPLLY